jgi:F0F1-type ATP synthase delta subunit
MEEASRKVRRAVVVSAQPLDADQLATLAEGLAARHPGYTYLLENEVDASLIAGFRVEEDGHVTDTSLRHKLDGARRSLAAAPL